ncbi:MAG: peptidase S8 and S53 subtilisin kexin sedolisin, partial [Chloroflexi bacterium]
MKAAGSACAIRAGGSWGRRRPRAVIVLLGLTLALTASVSVVASVAAASGPSEAVIVRVQPGTGLGSVEQEIGALGGQVGIELPIIDGVAARVPQGGLRALSTLPGVVSVTPDAAVQLAGSTFDPSTDAGSLYTTTLQTGAQALWQGGHTGKGVDVALIDSGVAPVNGLTAPGKVVIGPDFTLDAFNADLRGLDGFGHGTHMAGIIGGRDAAATPGAYAGDSKDFVGMAPDSRIVSVKVADAQGNSDVAQVIAGIQWAVQHRTDNGLNIRILNLSFGTDSAQAYTIDPLAFAAEQAWRQGLVVVGAAGNFGNSSPQLADPAMDPYVIAAGAVDTKGTADTSDDTVATFSDSGSATRSPDLVAPGTHIASLRDPGSALDGQFGSTATVGGRF